MQYHTSEELSIGKIKFKGFNLGGHQIDCRIWKDYNAKVTLFVLLLILFLGFSTNFGNVLSWPMDYLKQPSLGILHEVLLFALCCQVLQYMPYFFLTTV
ncbi:unnamed protein product [Urochloa humidicola]